MTINGRVKGHTAERAVARYLRESGYPLAITSRNALGHDGQRQETDIIGVPGASIEVKNRQNLNIGASLLQCAIQGGPDKIPILVAKPYGVGMTSVGDWWAITYVRRFVPLLPMEGPL